MDFKLVRHACNNGDCRKRSNQFNHRRTLSEFLPTKSRHNLTSPGVFIWNYSPTSALLQAHLKGLLTIDEDGIRPVLIHQQRLDLKYLKLKILNKTIISNRPKNCLFDLVVHVIRFQAFSIYHILVTLFLFETQLSLSWTRIELLSFFPPKFLAIPYCFKKKDKCQISKIFNYLRNLLFSSTGELKLAI